jgi:hypothetical protein
LNRENAVNHHDDEKTTEILILPKPLTGVGEPPKNNIVAFPSAGARSHRKAVAAGHQRVNHEASISHYRPVVEAAEPPRFADIDLIASPLVLRLLAVAFVAILSYLILS